ncbi:3-oxoacyl-(ACP) reductase [Planctomyces bekefii]|uniref:3-oxoacyl-(ACP) reductase n=1 Tax=Planctomyces bekefii TaxID=1653850 RepID=A0A5C6M6Q1_9PLAN|nr:3-oxoacyl-(ACP) reductase [Planctomyces bekefii]
MSTSNSQTTSVSNAHLKHILVAGSEGALGLKALEFFSSRGFHVSGTCRSKEELSKTQSHVQKLGLSNVRLFEADLSQEADVAKALAEAQSAQGPIDGLLNAAGGFRYGPVVEVTGKDYDFLVNANFKSSFLLAKCLTPGMCQRGSGSMVFISSKATLGPGEANMALYGATKAAVNALVTSLANEVKKFGVTVNAVMPSIIDTPANRTSMPDANFGDWVRPEALLEVILNLMGPNGRVINGALIPVPGRL